MNREEVLRLWLARYGRDFPLTDQQKAEFMHCNELGEITRFRKQEILKCLRRTRMLTEILECLRGTPTVTSNPPPRNSPDQGVKRSSAGILRGQSDRLARAEEAKRGTVDFDRRDLQY